jgi:hypothetical protein
MSIGSVVQTFTNVSNFCAQKSQQIDSAHSAIVQFAVEHQIFIKTVQVAMWGFVAYIDPKTAVISAALNAIPVITGVSIVPSGLCPSCLDAVTEKGEKK